MTNLFNMRCPECRGENRIDILAEVWVRLTENGTDADAANNGDHHFTPDSTAGCYCGYWGIVADFEVTEPAQT